MPWRRQVVIPLLAGKRRHPALARGNDAGNRLQLAKHLGVERDAGGVGDSRIVNVRFDHKNIVAVETCVESDEIRESVDKEPGADEENERESDLSGDDP